MNFVETYVDPVNSESNIDIEDIKDFRCYHCNHLKLSTNLIEALTQFRASIKSNMFVVQGYICRQFCEENGINPDTNSHCLGTSVNVHFGSTVPILEVLDIAKDYFPYLGVVRAPTGEFYLHLQYNTSKLYWLCAKTEDPNVSEYIYFKDYTELRNNVNSDWMC